MEKMYENNNIQNSNFLRIVQKMMSFIILIHLGMFYLSFIIFIIYNLFTKQKTDKFNYAKNCNLIHNVIFVVVC